MNEEIVKKAIADWNASVKEIEAEPLWLQAKQQMLHDKKRKKQWSIGVAACLVMVISLIAFLLYNKQPIVSDWASSTDFLIK